MRYALSQFLSKKQTKTLDNDKWNLDKNAIRRRLHERIESSFEQKKTENDATDLSVNEPRIAVI